MHVGKTIHALPHIGEILRVVADVQHNELRPGMARYHAVARFQYFRVTWKIIPVKRPIWMIVQLLETLVEAVDRQKEGFRIGNMDRNRNAQRTARFPHGIEALVIHFHERPRRNFLAQIQSERL